jgi:hypothetical protein
MVVVLMLYIFYFKYDKQLVCFFVSRSNGVQTTPFEPSSETVKSSASTVNFKILNRHFLRMVSVQKSIKCIFCQICEGLAPATIVHQVILSLSEFLSYKSVRFSVVHVLCYIFPFTQIYYLF